MASTLYESEVPSALITYAVFWELTKQIVAPTQVMANAPATQMNMGVAPTPPHIGRRLNLSEPKAISVTWHCKKETRNN